MFFPKGHPAPFFLVDYKCTREYAPLTPDFHVTNSFNAYRIWSTYSVSTLARHEKPETSDLRVPYFPYTSTPIP